MGAEGIVCLSHARWVWREGARKLHAYSAAPPVRAPPTGSQVGAYGSPPRGASPGLSGGRSVFSMRALRQRSGKCFFTRMSARVACRKGRSPTTLEWYSFGGGRGS